jgi:hypothetical protein
MSFHKEDRAKYVKSGQHLSHKMLKSVTEFFENIFNLQVADGSLVKKCKCCLPYPQNYITGNTPYGTSNATHTSKVIFKRYVTGTSAAKAGSPYPQLYFTGIAPKYNVQYR